MSGNAEAADAAADLAVPLTAAAAVACPCNKMHRALGSPRVQCSFLQAIAIAITVMKMAMAMLATSATRSAGTRVVQQLVANYL